LYNLILSVKKRMIDDKIKDEWLAHDLTLVKYYVNYSEKNSSRDSLMAQNILFLKKYYHKSKILFWAHNSHVQFGDGKGTGSFLKSQLHSDYQAIGFSTATGRNRLFSGYGKTYTMKLEQPYAGTAEYYLSSVPLNNYYLDVAAIRSGSENFSQLSNLNFRALGFVSMVDPQFLEVNFDLRQRFDGLVFVKESKPSVLIN
jgi:erythromycin esterase-like protein